MSQRRNPFGLRVSWLDGRVSEHWFRTPQVVDFMAVAFGRMRRDGWDDGGGTAQVVSVEPIRLEIIARAGRG